MNVKDKSIPELLALHAALLEELRRRGVLRSENNPTGDLAEYLFCISGGWQQNSNSKKAFDATDLRGTRYQIKGRRLTHHNPSRQLSQIRNLDGFDVLAAVLLDHVYRVERAALIPIDVVRRRSKFNAYTNSYRFMLQDGVWDEPEVEDVTDRLRAIEGSAPFHAPNRAEDRGGVVDVPRSAASVGLDGDGLPAVPGNQRDLMRRLARQYPNNPDAIISSYADAERAGEVPRRRNIHGRTPKDYAKALYADGVSKGWLPASTVDP